jgi:ADP-ribosyl-[dinitrogen reductase] hydrolase
MDKAEKIIDCIVGGAIGDCLGLPYEGQKQPNITSQYIWKISDDTQMTLSTCEAINTSGQRCRKDIFSVKCLNLFSKK